MKAQLDAVSLVKGGVILVQNGVSLVRDGASLVADGVSLVGDGVSFAEDGVSVVRDGVSVVCRSPASCPRHTACMVLFWCIWSPGQRRNPSGRRHRAVSTACTASCVRDTNGPAERRERRKIERNGAHTVNVRRGRERGGGGR